MVVNTLGSKVHSCDIGGVDEFWVALNRALNVCAPSPS